MTILDYIPTEIKLHHKGHDEYESPCPFCGGTDRFVIQAKVWETSKGNLARGVSGFWFCRQCKKRGDTLALLMELESLTYPEACEAVGYQSDRGKVRNQVFAKSRKVTIQGADVWRPSEEREPSTMWREVATQWLERCQRHITSPEAQNELQRRFLSQQQAHEMRLGWNPATAFLPSKSWGVDSDKDLVLPAGLVIPTFRRSGLHALKVRRLDAELHKLAGQGKSLPKYHAIKGGGNGHYVSGSPGGVVLLTESEIDSKRASTICGDVLCYLAIPAGTRPTRPEHDFLASSRRILIATDSDDAGHKAAEWFCGQYPQAVRITPQGHKSTGDMADDVFKVWLLEAVRGLRAHDQSDVEPEPVPDVEPLSCPAQTDRPRAMAHLTEVFNCFGLADRRAGRWIIYPGNQGGRAKLAQAVQWARNHAEHLAQEWPKIPGFTCTADRIISGA